MEQYIRSLPWAKPYVKAILDAKIPEEKQAAIKAYNTAYWEWMENNQGEYNRIKERFKYGAITFMTE